MAATITFSVSVDTTGKVATLIPGGGYSGTGIALTSGAGLLIHNNAAVKVYGYPSAASVVSGNIQLTLPAAFFGSETLQIDITAANTVTDSAANTPTIVTNGAVTNNSTVTGTTTNVITNVGTLFDVVGAAVISGTNGITDFNAITSQTSTTGNGGYSFEFVVNVTVAGTDVVLVQYLSTAGSGITYYQVDGGSQQTFQGHNLQFECVTLATNLAIGKHVFRTNLPANFYTRDLRLSGGTSSIVTVPCPCALFKDSLSGFTIPSQVSSVKRWGTLTYSGNRTNNAHPGLTFNVTVNATGLDCISQIRTFSGGLCASVDGGSYVYDQRVTAGNFNNLLVSRPAVAGMSAGAHRVQVLDVSVQSYLAVRAYNGTSVASSALAAQNQLVVNDLTNVADGDWLCVGHADDEEVVKVSSHTGTGPYTLTLAANLVKAHAAGAAVRNFTPAATPTMTDGVRPSFGRRMAAVGDSITHAEAVTTANVFPAPGFESYDPRASYAWLACQSLVYDFVGGATQGWTSANLVTDNAANNSDANKPADIYTILIGTNDFGSGNTTFANYEANLETVIGQCMTASPGGATILVSKIFSSTNVVSNGTTGLTKDDFNRAQVVAIANKRRAGFAIRQIELGAGLDKTANSTDIPDNTHPSVTQGQLKLQRNLLTHITSVGTSKRTQIRRFIQRSAA